MRLEGQAAQTVIPGVIHLLDQPLEGSHGIRPHVILDHDIFPGIGRIDQLVVNLVLLQAQVHAEGVSEGLRIPDFLKADAHFVDRTVARQQMAIAVVDLAALRIDGLELARVAVTLQEKCLRLVAKLDPDHLNEDGHACQCQEGHQDHRAESVLLSHD